MRKWGIFLIVILGLLVTACIIELLQFVKGVNKDTESRLNIAKNYIYGISFEGIIIKKYEKNQRNIQ